MPILGEADMEGDMSGVIPMGVNPIGAGGGLERDGRDLFKQTDNNLAKRVANEWSQKIK